MTEDVTRMQIEDYWVESPSYRTALYYGYLLTKEQNTQRKPCKDLRRMVSLQDVKFPDLIEDLCSYSIIDPETCLLTSLAMSVVRDLFIANFGSDDPPFNGLKIYRAKKPERQQVWVRAGSDYLSQLMKRIPDVKVTFEELSAPQSRFVIVERHLSDPIMVFWFVNMQRMRNIGDLLHLRTKAEELARSRSLELNRIGDPELINNQHARTVISIAAAPTYDEAVAIPAARRLPHRLIGPINLAAIGHYLSSLPTLSAEHYYGMINYLDPHKGGIVDSFKFIRFFHRLFGGTT